MENRLNHQAIEAYCEQFTNLVISKTFEKKEIINGKEVLALTPIKQVNYFLVKQLFVEWKEEIRYLKSPFFNYKAKEVRKALRDFMNILSNHIALEREVASKLLHKAVLDSILLVFSPYDYFCREINNPDKTRIRLKELEEIKKYIKVNGMILHHLIQQFKEEGLKEVFNDEAFRVLNEVFENITDSPEEVDHYYDDFSAILTLDQTTIYKQEKEEQVEQEELEDALETEEFLEEEVPEVFKIKEEESESFIEEDASVEMEAHAVVEVSDSDVEESEASQHIEEELMEEEPAATQEVESQEEVIQESDAEETEFEESGTSSEEVQGTKPSVTINDKFASDSSSLNDKHGQNDSVTLADKISKQSSKKPLIQSISINQRFMFLNELFEGNNIKLEATLNDIDKMQSIEEAYLYIKNRFPKWDREKEEVLEFISLIERKL